MADYITPAELREWIGSDITGNDPLLQACCTAATAFVDDLSDRNFSPDANVTTMYYDWEDYYCVEIDDVYTTSGFILTTDDHADGTYSTTWTLNTDYILEPVNQVSGAIKGYPYTRIRAIGGRAFPRAWYIPLRPGIKVVGKLGWAAVPDLVKQATLMLGAWIFKQKDAPDGFIGIDGWGPTQMKENRSALLLLRPYMKSPIAIG